MTKPGDLKYNGAIEIFENDPELRVKHRQFKRMDRNTLYSVLSGRGYDWNVAGQVWEPRQTLVLQAPQQVRTVKAHQKTLNNVFLVRIMAEKSQIDKIEADFLELAEALNWSIARDSREYPNAGEGNWVRKYYTVKRG